MSDSDGKKTLGLRGTPRSGNVKQSFSHGRTKNVLVETKRKRVVVPKAGTPVQPGTNPAKTQSSNRPAGISDTEMARRLKAVQAAKAREAEDTATRAAEEENRQKERERRRAEQAEKEREQREAEEIARKKTEEETLEMFNNIVAAYPDQALILRGDKEASFDHIVKILNLCKKANIWNISFATSQPESPQ